MATQFEMQVERLNTSEILTIQTREFNNRTHETIDAKKLHAFLGVGRDFSNWIKSRIKQYEFAENEDFILIPLNDQSGFSPKRAKTSNTGGRPSKDYFITLDMAKELAMVERNEKGREARRYFIECEHKLRNNQVTAIDYSGYDQKVSEYGLPEDHEALLEQAKYQMLNSMVNNMHFKDDAVVIPSIELARMVHAIRAYQEKLAFIAKQTKSPVWVEDQIKTIKAYTNRTLVD